MPIPKTSEIKLMIRLSLPLMAAFLAQKGMQLIDTIMMGWIGPEALAAGALGISTYMTILVFCRGVLSAVGIAIAQAKVSEAGLTINDELRGKTERKTTVYKQVNEIPASAGTSFERSFNKANRVYHKSYEENKTIQSLIQHGYYMVFLLSVPCIFLIKVFPDLLILAGQNPIIITKVRLLLNGLAWGFPGMLLFFLFREFVSAISFPRIIMVVSLFSIPLTFITNYVLIYGKFGLPTLGIAGIGYAGSIIMWIMFLVLFLYSKQHYHLKKFVIFTHIKYEAKKLSRLFKIGMPSGIIFMLDAGIFLIAATFMGYYGVDALASYQIAMQSASIAYNIPLAISVATGLLVGQAVTAKNISQIWRYSFISVGLALLTSMSVVLLFTITPETVVRLFVNIHEMHYSQINQLAKSFLQIAALFLCFDAIQVVATGILKGFNDTFVPMILFIICYCLIGLVSAYYLSFSLKVGAVGIWYGLTLGIFSVGVVLCLRVLKTIKNIEFYC